MKIILVNSITLYKSVVILQHGLLSLGTILKAKGYDVEIADFNHLARTGVIPDGSPGEMIRSFSVYISDKKADVVGFNSICAFYPQAILVAEMVKKQNPAVKIVFGGPQASSCPVETLTAFNWIDMIAIGESEQNIVDLIEALTGRRSLDNVAGIAFRKEGRIVQNPQAGLISDLDELPIPDYSLIPHMKSINLLSVEVGRGCPFSCRFCSTKTYWKKRFRLKSVARIVKEMDSLNEEFGFKHFFFLHDHFTVNKKTILSFCSYLKAGEKMYTWECYSRADTLDKELIETMKNAGCTKISIGIETGSPRMQHLIGKNLDLPSAWEIIKEIVRNNLKVKLSFIYALPEEEEQDLKKTLDLIRRSVVLGVDEISLFPFILLNGADYYDKYKNDLVQIEEYNSNIDERNGDETFRLIRNHPAVFPSFYRFPSVLFDKYRYLDVFVTYYSFLQRYFPFTFRALLELFRLDLGALYLDFLRIDLRFGEILSETLRNDEEIEWSEVLSMQVSFLDHYIHKSNPQNELEETFETEKTLLSRRRGIPGSKQEMQV